MLIHVASFRKGGTKALPDTQIVDVSRRNRILGNPFLMKDDSESSRQEVIVSFRKLIERDFSRKGLMFKECVNLAKLALSGRTLSLCCWCAPLGCHADVIREKVLFLCTEEGRKLYK